MSSKLVGLLAALAIVGGGGYYVATNYEVLPGHQQGGSKGGYTADDPAKTGEDTPVVNEELPEVPEVAEQDPTAPELVEEIAEEIPAETDPEKALRPDEPSIRFITGDDPVTNQQLNLEAPALELDLEEVAEVVTTTLPDGWRVLASPSLSHEIGVAEFYGAIYGPDFQVFIDEMAEQARASMPEDIEAGSPEMIMLELLESMTLQGGTVSVTEMSDNGGIFSFSYEMSFSEESLADLQTLIPMLESELAGDSESTFEQLGGDLYKYTYDDGVGSAGTLYVSVQDTTMYLYGAMGSVSGDYEYDPATGSFQYFPAELDRELLADTVAAVENSFAATGTEILTNITGAEVTTEYFSAILPPTYVVIPSEQFEEFAESSGTGNSIEEVIPDTMVFGFSDITSDSAVIEMVGSAELSQELYDDSIADLEVMLSQAPPEMVEYGANEDGSYSVKATTPFGAYMFDVQYENGRAYFVASGKYSAYGELIQYSEIADSHGDLLDSFTILGGSILEDITQ